MSLLRLTDMSVPAHSSAYFMRVTQSVAGVAAPAERMWFVEKGWSALGFDQTTTRHR